jgi:hypothetical protein
MEQKIGYEAPFYQNGVVLGHMNNLTYVHYCFQKCDAQSVAIVPNSQRNMLPLLLGTLHVHCRLSWVVNIGTLSNVGHKFRKLCARLAICLSAKIFILPLQSKQQE